MNGWYRWRSGWPRPSEEGSPIPGEPDNERGTYILLAYLRRDQTITIGRLGPIHFLAGTYAYCGSAMAGYRGRVGRHFSRDKKLRWHIDFLLEEAEPMAAYLAPGGKGVECALGMLLSGLEGSQPIKGFGCSDCGCISHLFWIEGSSIPDLLEKMKAARFGICTAAQNH